MSSIRSNSTDLRVRKTIRDIQNALLVMIVKKPYKQIRVNDVLKEAMVIKKTFYRHFASLDAVLGSVRESMVEEMEKSLRRLEPSDLSGGVLVFYNFLSSDDKAYQKLFTEDQYADFFNKLKMDFFSLDFFRTFYAKSEYPEVMPGYFSSAATIYAEWKTIPEDERGSVEDLADTTAELFLHGLQ